MRDKLLAYLFMIIAVPIAGELKFYPLDGDIRVSLGTPLFFFILLWSRKIYSPIAGLLTGTAVVLFRICLYEFQADSFQLLDPLYLYYPVFFYYSIYALLFYAFKINTFHDSPFIIGLLGVVIEVIASLVEIICRSFTSNIPITLSSLMVVGGIAIIRSFFVLGFFNIFIIRETKLAEEQQKRLNEQILLIISNLYVEMVQLKKSMKNAEELTSVCYGLYRDLKELESNNHAQTALKIAGQMHEIKKDNQRIYAGLTKLMIKENLSDFMAIEEIIEVIVRSNKNYGDILGKSIDYQVNISGDHPYYRTIILFSLINNLVSNAVEAIFNKGLIELTVKRMDEMAIIIVNDNGSGISEKNKRFIFEPGFTTKFDQTGMASNGIGLSYIKNVIENIGGRLNLLDSAESNKTSFEIQLPVTSLTERG
ncbi:sensor histidine kinase [Neobacillus drentensis]|uniref:sensor histidine kinase n=1 Tax=Neobacillus drentensis TaxID=220684 RepID=UPI000BF31773|nr:histidine kinase [Bacillus sp. AFS006103]